MSGLVHIYTGDGKGKTTAAVGLGIRAFGRGLKVVMVQFLKGMDSGELKVIENLGENFLLYRGEEVKKFIWNMNEQEKIEAGRVQQRIFKYAVDAVSDGKTDMLILDEIMAAVEADMVDINELINLITNKPKHLEIVMTGRNAPERLIKLADYVSEIKAVFFFKQKTAYEI